MEAMYRPKFTNVSMDEIDKVQTKLKETILHKCGLNKYTSSRIAWGKHLGLELTRWADLVNTERLHILIHALNQDGTPVRELMLDAIDRLQQKSGSNNPVLNSAFATSPASKTDPTWMYRLWEWMSTNNISIENPEVTKALGRDNGISLSHLMAGLSTHERSAAVASFQALRCPSGSVGARNNKDITMRDGRTLTPQARASPAFMTFATSTLQVVKGRTLPQQYQFTHPISTPEIGD
jgi:hypothetical protein